MTTPLKGLETLGVALAVATTVGTNELTGGTCRLIVVKTSFKPPMASIFVTLIELKTFAISPVLSLPLSVLLLLSLSVPKADKSTP
ncbi:hypothetical protein Tco_0837366 [Tanacetum coccineum]